MLLHVVLASLLALQPPSEQAAQARFNAGDYSGALALYLDLANQPGVHPPDPLAGAHECLLALFRSTQNPAYLCRARLLTRELLTRDVFADADERTYWHERDADDGQQLKAASVECEPVRTSPPPPAPRVLAPEGPPPAPSLPRARPTRRRVGQAIGGAGLLLAGSGLALGTVASLLARDRANARIAALDAGASNAGRDLTPDERASVTQDDRRYVRLSHAATVLGVSAGISLVLGLVLLALPARPRSVARLRWRPAGLSF